MVEVREDALITSDWNDCLPHAHLRTDHIARLLVRNVFRKASNDAFILRLNRCGLLDSFLRIHLEFFAQISFGMRATK